MIPLNAEYNDALSCASCIRAGYTYAYSNVDVGQSNSYFQEVDSRADFSGFCCRTKADGNTICEMDNDLYQFFRDNSMTTEVKAFKSHVDNITASPVMGGITPIQVALKKIYALYDVAKLSTATTQQIDDAKAEFLKQLKYLYFYENIQATKTDELLGYIATIEAAVTGGTIHQYYLDTLNNDLNVAYNASSTNIDDQISMAYWLVTDYDGYNTMIQNTINVVGGDTIKPEMITWLKGEEKKMKTRTKHDGTLANTTLDDLVILSRMGYTLTNKDYTDTSTTLRILCDKYQAVMDTTPTSTREPTKEAADILYHYFKDFRTDSVYNSGSPAMTTDLLALRAGSMLHYVHYFAQNPSFTIQDITANSSTRDNVFIYAIKVAALVFGSIGKTNDQSTSWEQNNFTASSTNIQTLRQNNVQDAASIFEATTIQDGTGDNAAEILEGFNSWASPNGVTTALFNAMIDYLCIIRMDDVEVEELTGTQNNKFGALVQKDPNYTTGPPVVDRNLLAGVEIINSDTNLGASLEALVTAGSGGLIDADVTTILAKWDKAGASVTKTAPTQFYPTVAVVDLDAQTVTVTALTVTAPSGVAGDHKTVTSKSTSADFTSPELALSACPHPEAQCGAPKGGIAVSGQPFYLDKNMSPESININGLSEKDSCHFIIKSDCDVPVLTLVNTLSGSDSTVSNIGMSYIEYQNSPDLSIDGQGFPPVNTQINVVENAYNYPEGTLGNMKITASDNTIKLVSGEFIKANIADYTSKISKYNSDLTTYNELKDAYNKAVKTVEDEIKFESLTLTDIPAKPKAPKPLDSYDGFYQGQTGLDFHTGFGKITAGQISLDKDKYGAKKHFGVFGQGDTDGLGVAEVVKDSVDSDDQPICTSKTILLNVYPLMTTAWTQDVSKHTLIMNISVKESLTPALLKPEDVTAPEQPKASPFKKLLEADGALKLFGGMAGLASLLTYSI